MVVLTISSVAAMASGMQQAQLQNEVKTGVAKMALDTTEVQGEALVEMLEGPREEISEFQEHLGNSVDTRA